MTLLGAAAVGPRSLPVFVLLLLVVVLVFEAAFAAAGGNNDVAPVSYAMLSGAERRARSIASFDRRDELEDILATKAAAKAATTAKKRGSSRQGGRVVSGPEGGGGRYWKGLNDRTSWTGFYTDDFDREGIVVPERKKKEEEGEEEVEVAAAISKKKRKKKKAVREKAGRRGYRAPSASSRRPKKRRRAGTKKNDDVDDDVPPPLERARYFFPSDLKPDVEGSRSMWFEYPQRGREMVRTVPRSMGFYSNDLVSVETWVS